VLGATLPPAEPPPTFPDAMIATPTFPDLAALVVDESLYIRRIVRDMLMRVGIKRILEAPDGAEALGVLAESKPDLVILDWDLAILSGEEFIRLTRTPTTSPAPTVPIILMLAQPRRNVVDRAVNLGVNEVIAKPFSPKTLWSRLDEVINRPRPFAQVKSLLRPQPRAGSAAAPKVA
jgi:two-component system, chemotaxis family, chemotaxis protein CheY